MSSAAAGKFQRIFLIFSNEDNGFEDGKKPSGHLKLEIRGGKGRLETVVHNLRDGKGRFVYALYLIRSSKDPVEYIRAGELKHLSGRDVLEWTFDPVQAGQNADFIYEFDIAAILAEHRDRTGSGVICPLAAYKGRRTEWRGRLRRALYEAGAAANRANRAAEADVHRQSRSVHAVSASDYGESFEMAGVKTEKRFISVRADSTAQDKDDAAFYHNSEQYSHASGRYEHVPDKSSAEAAAESGLAAQTGAASAAGSAVYAGTAMNAGLVEDTGYAAAATPAEDGESAADVRFAEDDEHSADVRPVADDGYGLESGSAEYAESSVDDGFAGDAGYDSDIRTVDDTGSASDARPVEDSGSAPAAQASVNHTDAPFSAMQAEKEDEAAQLRQPQSTEGYNINYASGPRGINTECVYLNGNICGAFLNGGNSPSPCDACRISHTGAPSQVRPAGDLEKLQKDLDDNFEVSDPFNSRRSDYKWWRVTNPVNLNNILYQNNIRSPLMFNPAVMMAHYKYRHLIIGIFMHRNGKKYVVCGVPGMHMVDMKPFGEMNTWVQADGNRLRYGAFGYWLIYIDPENGRIMKLNRE